MRTIIYDQDVKAIDLTNPLPVVNGYNANDSFNATLSTPDARTAQVIKTATSGKSIYVTDLVISAAVADNIRIQDSTATAVVHMSPIYLEAGTSIAINFSTPLKITASKDLKVKATVVGNVTVTATGFVA